MINLCFSLLSLYLVFVIGIDRTQSKSGCIAVSVLLHYFMLTTIAWVAVEGVNKYLLFAKLAFENKFTLKKDRKKFMLKACAFAWGKLVAVGTEELRDESLIRYQLLPHNALVLLLLL